MHMYIMLYIIYAKVVIGISYHQIDARPTQHKVEGESVTTLLFLHTTHYYTEQMRAGHIPLATACCGKRMGGNRFKSTLTQVICYVIQLV